MTDVSQPPPLAAVRRNAEAMRDAGQAPAARQLLSQAIDAGRPAYGEDHPEVLATAHLLARMLMDADDPMAARRVLEEALAAGQRRWGDAHQLVLAISFDLGRVAEELGNRHEARRNFNRVSTHGPGVLGADHPAVRTARAYLEGAAQPVIPAFDPGPTDRPFTAAEPAGLSSSAPEPASQPHTPPAVPAPISPAQPVQPTQPVQPAQPVPPAPSARPAQPAQPAPLTPPAPSAPTTRPVASARPVPPTQPVTPAQPAQAGPSGQPRHPAGPIYPGQNMSDLALYPVVVPRTPAATPQASAPTGRGRISGATAAAVVAASAAVIAAVVGVVAVIGDEDPVVPTNPTAPPSAAVEAGAPPTDLQLQDNQTAITITWTDPSGGTVPFVVAGGRAGQRLGAMATVEAGRTSHTINGLSPRVDYCFTVLAVYATDNYAASGQVCTNRGGTPTPAG